MPGHGYIPTSLMRLALPFVAFVLSAGLIGVLLHPAVRRWFLDHPNQRSLHKSPVPRSGGLAIVAGTALTLGASGLAPSVLWGMMLLVGISVVDDLRELPAWLRLIGHIAVAAVFVTGLDVVSGILPLCVCTVGIVWMINLYNFMDGADGLAGGMATVGFATLGVAAMQHGEVALASAGFGIAASALAFLLFNFPPARIFMGDAGSIPCGFLAAALGLIGWSREAWPIWFPVVVFGPFIADASVTLVRRLIRGERVWHAHRSHYYQRQVLMGWTHRRLATAEYALMAAGSVVGLLALQFDSQHRWILLGALFAVYLVLMISVDVRWAKQGAANA